MDAKEWLEKEGFLDKVRSLDCETTTGFGYPLEVLLERFANNKTQELQAKILHFRQELKKHLTFDDKNALENILAAGEEIEEYDYMVKLYLDAIENNPTVKLYDTYFGITSHKEGKIGNND